MMAIISAKNSEDVFNPFSLVKALNAREIAPYWFGSGTPSFLLKLLDKYHVNLASLEGQEAVLNSFDQSTEEMTDACAFALPERLSDHQEV